jgi:hypothetical protein
VRGNGLAGRIFGQWQLAPIVSMRSGFPIIFPATSPPVNSIVAADISQTGVGLDRPNLVGGCNPYGNPQVYLNSACFQVQAAGTFGNLGRNVLIGPGAINVDVALTRTFRFRERWQLTPRAEVFNVINHANFANTGTILGSPQFGVINVAADPRILQFALKLQF